MTARTAPSPAPDGHELHVTYRKFSGGGSWACSCGARGTAVGSPVDGWQEHVAAVTRDDDDKGEL